MVPASSRPRACTQDGRGEAVKPRGYRRLGTLKPGPTQPRHNVRAVFSILTYSEAMTLDEARSAAAAEDTRTQLLALGSGIVFGGGAFLSIVHAVAALQVGVLQGIPWGSSLAMASLIAGLAMLMTMAITAGTVSTWTMLAACATAFIFTASWAQVAGTLPLFLDRPGDQLAWSPLVSGLTAALVGATYACGSARRAGIDQGRAEAALATPSPHRRLYLRPAQPRTSWALSLLIAAIAGLVLHVSVLWLAAHAVIDPLQVALVATGTAASHRFAIVAAVLASAILVMSASLSAFGPTVASLAFMILPSAYASIVQLFTLGQSITRESLRDLTLAAPVLGVWGTVVLALTIATAIARRNGLLRARIQAERAAQAAG